MARPPRSSVFARFLFGCFVMPLAGLIVSGAETALAYSVAKVFPQGTTKQVRQVRVRFSEPMVPFGDARPAMPATVECTGLPKDVTGSGRWLEPKEWVYDFSAELPAGVSCRVDVRADRKSEKGGALTGKREFDFSTGGPAVTSTRPWDGDSVEEDSGFLLLTDADVEPASILRHAYFVVDGVGEKISAKLADRKTTEAVLKAGHYYSYKGPAYVLTATRRFPVGKKLKLVWDKGIKSKTGVETTKSQTFTFRVREPFTAKFSCFRENETADCSPLLAMQVTFSTPIARADAAKVQIKDKSGKVLVPHKIDEKEETISSVSFDPPFEQMGQFTVTIDKSVKDESGRALQNAAKFPVTARTSNFQPLAKFAATFGIIESRGGAALPVTVRRLEKGVAAKFGRAAQGKGKNGKEIFGFEIMKGKTVRVESPKEIMYWLNRLENMDREVSLFDKERRFAKDEGNNATGPDGPDGFRGQDPEMTSFELPQPEKEGDTNVIGIPLKKTGFYVVEIESKSLGAALLGKNEPMYVPAEALVTNMGVHFKWGGERSLAWVTSLDSGKTVANALVQIFDCKGASLFEGKTDRDGVVEIANLPLPDKVSRCEARRTSKYVSGVFVFASKGPDLSFTHSKWDDGIETWRFSVPTNYDMVPPAAAHTILDRTLFRAGETVHMKHVFRRRVGTGFDFPSKDQMPPEVEITFAATGDAWKLPLTWKADGTADMTWQLPKEAKLGSYSIRLLGPATKEEAKPSSEDTYTPPPPSYGTGSFQVEEFRVSLMKATLKPPGEQQILPKAIEVPINIQYLAGGGAGNLPVKVRGYAEPKTSFSVRGQPDFSFRCDPVKVGKRRWGANEEEGEGEGAIPRSSVEGKKNTTNLDVVLDSLGSGKASFSNVPTDKPYDYHVEAEYRDPNGETQTAAQTIEVFPGKFLVGFDSSKWANLKDDVQLRMIVVDLQGKVQKGVAVDVALFARKNYSHRKRVLGGFYSYESYEEVTSLNPAFCHGQSDSLGIVTCNGKVADSGNFIAQATVKDEQGRKAVASQEFWVAGGDDWWFSADAGDRIDLVPEQKEYQPGEKAVFQVRSPFREATALVTIEREGILDHFTTTISGKNPTISVPLKGFYAPNVFVSALVVRGRVGDVKPTALVDLGKPAFKMGLAQVKVGWSAHRLKVEVKPDKEFYKPRQKAKVAIKVSPEAGNESMKGASVVVAAVDEGLLQLSPNRSWDILAEMMGERGHAVRTSTGSIQVIGKRHFGLKSIPAGGGGGGVGTPRKLFDTLLLWSDQLTLDDKGEATVEVPINDSLTSFKVVAIVMAGKNKFGTGDGTIRSSQDVLVFSGLPPLVRTRDKYRAMFTVRNTTAQPLDIEMTPSVGPKITAAEATLKKLDARKVHLDKGESQEVTFEYQAPAEAGTVLWHVETTVKSKLVDSLEVAQRVVPAVPVRVLMGTLGRAEPSYSLSVQRPADAVAGVGGIHVDLSASLVGQLGSTEQYMREYPYSCLEQRLSKAITLNDHDMWQGLNSSLGNYLDSDGLATYFPGMTWGSEVLTAYVLTASGANGFVVSPSYRDRMVAGLKSWLNGKIIHGNVNGLAAADQPLRKVAALLALSWAGGDSFEPKLIGAMEILPALWPTTTLLEWYELLLREQGIKDRSKRLKEAEQAIRARLHTEGTAMALAKSDGDGLPWLMFSGDQATARLVFIAAGAQDWHDDTPRLVQGLFTRMLNGHWDLTTANAWAAMAMRQFAKGFEQVAVAGKTVVQLGKERGETVWKAAASKKGARPGPKLMAPLEHAFQFPLAGSGRLDIQHQGAGKPWATVSSHFAIPLKAPVSAGMTISRKIVPVEQKTAGKWTRGDVARVELTMNSSAAQSWVVVNDPIPAGASILGRIGDKGQALRAGEETKDSLWPAFEEKSFEGMRVYYSFVPDKTWTYSYTFRLNQDGAFELPPSRVEAMYAPGMYGETPAGSWLVAP